MVTFYLARTCKTGIEALAVERGETQADTVRAMLAYAQQRMPRSWHPKETR
jgi:hypothetical protein